MVGHSSDAGQLWAATRNQPCDPGGSHKHSVYSVSLSGDV